MAELKSAAYFRKEPGDKVACLLCPHQCLIQPGGRGVCAVRQNRAGELVAENYNQVGALHLDPIEKKPLYHFYPGSQVLSIGTFGCNFNCSFCQNWQLSKGKKGNWELKPQELINLIEERFPVGQGNIGIAFTYNEPLVWYEYLLEAAQLAKGVGMQVVLITNGFVNRQPFVELLSYVDALNIDLKSFREEYYGSYCGGSLKPVLGNIEAAAHKCHVEITTLLVTGLNDSRQELREMAQWLSQLDKNIPWHISRYYPNYKLDVPPTSLETMEQALEVGRNYLNYVYLGNVPQKELNDTYCHECRAELISRKGYQVEIMGLTPGTRGKPSCTRCGQTIPIRLS